jgi:hypothetical protein
VGGVTSGRGGGSEEAGVDGGLGEGATGGDGVLGGGVEGGRLGLHALRSGLVGRRGGDGAMEEGLEVGEEFRLVHAEVVVEEEEELSLHEVDLGRGEESAVASPVLVLRRRV